MSNNHSYSEYAHDVKSAEFRQLQSIKHLTTKVSAERFRKTPEEKAELKKHMHACQFKKHSPVTI